MTSEMRPHEPGFPILIKYRRWDVWLHHTGTTTARSLWILGGAKDMQNRVYHR